MADDVERPAFGRGAGDVELRVEDAVLLVEGPRDDLSTGSYDAESPGLIQPLVPRSANTLSREGNVAGMSETASEQPEPITKQRPSAAM